jgi:putative heme-binding domain-containing protein
MQLLDEADTHQEKLLWLYELRNVRKGWTLDLQKRYLEQLAEADRFEGGRELSVAVFSIKSEFCVTLTPEEKSELVELLAPPPAIDSATLTANRPLVRKWQTADLESELAAIGRGRDFERGRRLFGEALCSRCHRFGGEGRPIGPDLAAVSHRFGRRDLVESVLVPSMVVDGKYRDTTLVLLSGKVLTGRIVGGDESSWLVATNAQSPFETIKVDIAEIESQTPSETSPMPEGLLDTFSADEILDLVAYLESDGRADSSHFQP